ncbi:MAG: hypothetical protein V1793_20250 [Pseudomonadota bacterium]
MKNKKEQFKSMVTLNMMNSREHSTCAFCGHRFSLGEPVVLASGGWHGGPRLVHERDAVYDRASGTYVERRCFEQVMVCRAGKT